MTMLWKTCLFVLFAVSYSLKSPVLIWSTSRGLSDLPESQTGQTIKTEDFHDFFLKPLSKEKNLVVFAQDRLSLQDLNQHADVYNPYSDGGAFKNIKAFMDDQFSVQIPSVLSPWAGLEKIMNDFEGKVHQIMESADIDKLDLGGHANLIIVSLSPVQGSSNERKAFQDNDEKIAEVTKQLSKRGVEYTALYTGKTSVKTSEEKAGVSRHLQAVEEDVSNSTLLNITCGGRDVFFYMRALDVTVVKSGNMFNTTNVTIKDSGTTCDNDTVLLKLVGTAADSFSINLDWTINIDNISEYFNITQNSVMVTYMNNSQIEKANETLVLKELMAPKDFSYHCSSLKIKTPKSNETKTNVTLTFDGLQIQPFNIRDDQFSDGWDCVTFFTPGIWMAIISVLIFTLIILFGLGMIASLKTMDRYDDPKGKTITVNASE